MELSPKVLLIIKFVVSLFRNKSIIRCTDNLGHFIEMKLEGGFKMGTEGNTEGYNVISVKRNLHHETGLRTTRGYRKPIDMASITAGNVEDLYCYFLNRKMGFCSLKSCKHFQGCNRRSRHGLLKSPTVSEKKSSIKLREVKK